MRSDYGAGAHEKAIASAVRIGDQEGNRARRPRGDDDRERATDVGVARHRGRRRERRPLADDGGARRPFERGGEGVEHGRLRGGLERRRRREALRGECDARDAARHAARRQPGGDIEAERDVPRGMTP